MPKYLVTVAQAVSKEWFVAIEADSEGEAEELAIARVFGRAPFEDAEPIAWDNCEPLDAPEAINVELIKE